MSMGCFALAAVLAALLTDARSHVIHEVDNKNTLDIHVQTNGDRLSSPLDLQLV